MIFRHRMPDNAMIFLLISFNMNTLALSMAIIARSCDKKLKKIRKLVKKALFFCIFGFSGSFIRHHGNPDD